MPVQHNYGREKIIYMFLVTFVTMPKNVNNKYFSDNHIFFKDNQIQKDFIKAN